jgi:hypothetical protein
MADVPEFRIAMCLPADPTGLPAEVLAELHPPQVDDTLMACQDCGRDCWVGPRKRILAALGQAHICCYQCGIAMMESREGLVEVKYVDLHPDRPDRPRR